MIPSYYNKSTERLSHVQINTFIPTVSLRKLEKIIVLLFQTNLVFIHFLQDDLKMLNVNILSVVMVTMLYFKYL